jgi:AcrR family transcriptional regulator
MTRAAEPPAQASDAVTGGSVDLPAATPPTNAERRKRRHARTRRDILAAAREVMLESGASGITVREVAHRADFSPAALYKYFSGRDEIIAALTQESFLILKRFIDGVPTSLSPDKRLVALGMAYMKFAQDNPADLACILDSTTRPLPEGFDLAAGLAAVTALRSTLEEGVHQGLFRELTQKELAVVAYGLWSLVHGMTTLRGIDLGPVSQDIVPEPRRVLRTYIDGLRRT